MYQPSPETPPGMENIQTILNWIAWGAIIIAVAGFLIGLIMLVTGAISGREQSGIKVIVISMIVAVAIGSVGAIMAVLI